MKSTFSFLVFLLFATVLHAQRNDSVSVKTPATNPDSIVYLVPAAPDAPAGDTVHAKYVEVAPEFPGGEREYFHFLIANLRYPQKEKENGVQGRVYISFIVEPNGTITNIQPVKEVEGGPGLTKEAMRVLRLMPKWKPGTVGGKPVRTKVVLPVNFRLS